jgi:hypothetical protein
MAFNKFCRIKASKNNQPAGEQPLGITVRFVQIVKKIALHQAFYQQKYVVDHKVGPVQRRTHINTANFNQYGYQQKADKEPPGRLLIFV